MNDPSPSMVSIAEARRADGRAGLRNYRFLVRQLVRVNLYTEFKRSIIGLSWLFLLPLLAVAIWILLNRAGVVEPGDTTVPYPAYVLLSTSIWGFFADLYKSSSQIFVQNGKMLLMTPFPAEVFIIERVVVHLIRFSIPFALNIGVLLYFGVSFSWAALLFPISLLPLLLLGLAIGLLVGLLRIVALDLSKIADEGIRLLMFLTPIVYAPRIQLGWLSEIVAVNPLTYLVGFSRDLLTQGTFYEPGKYFLCFGLTLVVFGLVLRMYHGGQSRILERLISA